MYNEVLWDRKNTPDILSELSKTYKFISRYVIVFIVSDFEKRYDSYSNLIVFRTSLRRSLKRKNEFVMPYIWEHLPEPFPVITTDKPQIGFCGLVSSHRKSLIDCFEQSKDVNVDFVLRDKFWGGAPHDEHIITVFNENLKNSPFIIAQRGNGNFSMRFYQTLAAGRIPVLVNTDMVLPFDDVIDWSRYIIFEKNPQRCLQKLLRVFESGAYLQMQKDCYKLFDQYFSTTTLFSQITDQILRAFT